jgi:hypothetical protein
MTFCLVTAGLANRNRHPPSGEMVKETVLVTSILDFVQQLAHQVV